MKRLLFASTIMLLAINSGLAQQSVKPTGVKTANVAKESTKVLFNKKLTELKDLLKKEDKEAATKTYMDMFELLQKAMSTNNEKLAKSTNDAEKTLLQKNITEEQTLYGEIKMQLIDIIGNKDVLIAKLEAYSKTIQ